MRQKDYPFSKILTLHLDKARNVELNSADLAELRLYSKEGLEFIQRSCIRFRSDLLLSDAEAGKLYSQKIDCQTAEEIHTLGCWKIKADKKMGEDLLRQAFSLGCEKSGDILLSVVRDRENKKSEKTLRFLARALHPEANYIYGKLCFEKYKNQKQADVHLRIAAAKGHMCALLEVARLEYHKFNNTHNNQNHKNTLRIYAHLWRENKKLFQQKDLLDFACCLHRERNFIKALEILSLCDVPHAYYLLGRMHHYGDGTAIDYNKAKEYYKKCGNHRRAQELLTKLENSIKAKQQRERIRTKSYSRKEKTTSSSSSSACFLTTATCQVMGYEDDCDVLQTFRLYRDRILAQQKGGNDLIANYYNLAPKILEKIDADKQPELVYQHMWNHYIKPAYNLLQNKQYNEAQKLYIELVTLLQNKYGLKNGGSCRVSGSF
jgi:TPR repeat protein